MARYFFDLFDGDDAVSDDEGLDIYSRTDISREVSRILADIAREEIMGRQNGAISIRVRDDDGEPVFTGSLSFHTEWLGRGPP